MCSNLMILNIAILGLCVKKWQVLKMKSTGQWNWHLGTCAIQRFKSQILGSFTARKRKKSLRADGYNRTQARTSPGGTASHGASVIPHCLLLVIHLLNQRLQTFTVKVQIVGNLGSCRPVVVLRPRWEQPWEDTAVNEHGWVPVQL